MHINVITTNAFDKLSALASDACCIRCAMAFWTIPSFDLPSQVVDGLKAPNGFLCVDIHNPTSIDALSSVHAQGVDVRLHLASTTGKSEIEDSTGMPNHLMHAKVIIFDYPNKEPVVWVGSHNGTFRALDGINIECSLAISTSPESALYKEVSTYLTSIAQACQPFNPDLIPHYRFLQSNKVDGSVSVMEFENETEDGLVVGDEISVFNMSRDDHRAIKTIDTDIVVSLHGKVETLYFAKVVQTGETPSKANQSFGSRRFADLLVARLPLLVNYQPVTAVVHTSNTFYAVLKIVSVIDVSHRLLEIPTQSGWVNASVDEVSDLLHSSKRATVKSKRRTTQPKGLKFKVPGFAEMGINATEEIALGLASPTADIATNLTFAFREMRLEDKQKANRSSLICKKVLATR